MKILLMAPYFPPEGGAASHLYYELGKALLARGHEISVLTGIPRYHVVGDRRSYRGPVHHEIFQGMQVYRVFKLDAPRDSLILRGLEEFISALSYGFAGFLLTEFDIALVHSPPLPLALATLCMARLRGKAAVLNVHDIFPQCGIDLGLISNPHLIKFFRALEGFLYRHFDFNMANSDDNKKYIISRGGPPEKVMAVYHWVNTEEIKPGPRGNSIRKKLNLKNEFIVSFAGLMGVSQDLDTVLEAAGLLRDYQEITFLLVGDGVEKPRLERIAQKADLANVHFLPMLPKQEYPLVLAASDLCLATLRSTLRTPVVPSKIMSIMSAGRPVLGSFHLGGEASRLIEASQGGISVPPENPQEMTKAILTLYHDKKLAKTMGNNGRRYVERHYSMNVSVAKIEKLFATIFANRKPAHH